MVIEIMRVSDVDYHDDEDHDVGEDHYDNDEDEGNSNDHDQIWERFAWGRRRIWRPWRNPCPRLLSNVFLLQHYPHRHCPHYHYHCYHPGGAFPHKFFPMSSSSSLHIKSANGNMLLQSIAIWQLTQVWWRRPHWRRWKLERQLNKRGGKMKDHIFSMMMEWSPQQADMINLALILMIPEYNIGRIRCQLLGEPSHDGSTRDWSFSRARTQ